LYARLVAAASIVLLLIADGQAAEFVGSASCKGCHAAAYEAWAASPHARAMSSLTPEQQKNGQCLQCHAKDLAQGGEPGVSCETCHGPGQYYWPQYVMRDAELARATGLVLPDEKSCALCHDATSPALQPFDAAKKMKLIDHWTASRAARKAAAGKPRAQSVPRPCPRPGAGFLAAALRPKPPADASIGR
jgi:hypothetical protein